MPESSAPSSSASPSFADLLHRLVAGEDLTAEQTRWAMDRVMSGDATPVQVAGFFIALRAKGESVAELGGLVEAMLSHAVGIDVPGPAVDIVGTGGDRARTVNISTMAALVVAGAGVQVVKHGNRAASSACGSADVLEALGVRLDLAPSDVARVARDVGITFCFAQAFHPAMRHAAVARRELAVPTAFNFLGPLTNPGRPAASAIGVADLRMAPLMAGVLAERGVSAVVFRGEDGLDELTTSGPSRVWLVGHGAVEETLLDPTELGVASSPVSALRGDDAAYNAQVVRDLLAGAQGPVRDAVLLNAAAALVAADGTAPGEPASAQTLVPRMSDAFARAATSVDSGAAAQVLDRWVERTRSL
jgi:anthranilate phosphoribosyltransferase